MELTIIETSAYQELRKLVSTLAVQMGDFQKRIAPPAPGSGYSGDSGKRTNQKKIKVWRRLSQKIRKSLRN